MESTSHELESKASAAVWAELRCHMLVAVTEIAAMPLFQVCLHCCFLSLSAVWASVFFAKNVSYGPTVL